MNLNSKIAIVTGSSSGLGSAIATALIRQGATVYGLARNFGVLNEFRDSLGDAFISVRLDVTDREAIESWVDNTFSGDHSPDILINNAGAGYFAKIEELPVEQWHQMIDTNINGMYYLTSHIVPLMKQVDKTCHIVNIGSILGKVGSPERTGYCASKFAVQGFSEALSKELRYEKIKVTSLNPGSIDTHFFKESGIDAHCGMLQPNDIADTVIHLLKTPGNFLVSEMTVRPLNPKPPVC